MRHLLPALVALILLLSYGIAEGLWTNRWRLSQEVEQAAARLNAFPPAAGDWEGLDDKLDERQVARAEIDGYLMRRYLNRKTGATVTVLLVCGRPGPTALHSPDVCYAGAGYAPAAPPARTELAGSAGELPAPATFWVGEFRKPGPVPEPLRIYWAWSAAGAWEAPDSPRLHFAHHPALYKLYVIRPLSRPEEPLADDPARDLLQLFLPQVHQQLFARAAAEG